MQYYEDTGYWRNTVFWYTHGLRVAAKRASGDDSIIDPAWEAAPYNGTEEYSISTERAQKLGFRFSNLHDWIYGLLDYYIEKYL